MPVAGGLLLGWQSDPILCSLCSLHIFTPGCFVYFPQTSPRGVDFLHPGVYDAITPSETAADRWSRRPAGPRVASRARRHETGGYKTQEFICTKKQAKELDGLAFWVAELYNIRELFPNDQRNLDRCDASIRFAMDQLDRLAVPFWAQNAVINWAENWRNISSHDLKQAMKSRGVIM